MTWQNIPKSEIRHSKRVSLKKKKKNFKNEEKAVIEQTKNFIEQLEWKWFLEWACTNKEEAFYGGFWFIFTFKDERLA